MEAKYTLLPSPNTERWQLLFIIAKGDGFEGQEEELLLGQWLDKKRPPGLAPGLECNVSKISHIFASPPQFTKR